MQPLTVSDARLLAGAAAPSPPPLPAVPKRHSSAEDGRERQPKKLASSSAVEAREGSSIKFAHPAADSLSRFGSAAAAAIERRAAQPLTLSSTRLLQQASED